MKTEQEIKEEIKDLKDKMEMLNHFGGYGVNTYDIDDLYSKMKALEWVLEVNNDNK